MKQRVIILIMLIMTAFSGFSQIDEEISQSKKIKIENGRAYLLEKFLDRDYEKVKEIKDYLKSLEDDNYCAFYHWELWQILYWTSEFDALTVEFSIDSTDFHALDTKVLPGKDQLNQQLYQHSIEDEHILRSNLQEAKLDEEDNEFFSIFLDWNLKPLSNENQKIVNEELDKFLADYPNTRYEWVANNIIHMSYYEESDWGYGAYFDLCTGFSTGSMSRPVIGIGLCFDIYYKRLFLCMGYEIVGANTTIDRIISDDELCPKGTHVSWMSLYATLGYAIIDNNSIRLTPSLGVGGISESCKNQQHPEYEKLDKWYFTYNGSLTLDVKFRRPLMEGGGLRIRYNMGVCNMGNNEISTMHLISIGIGGGARSTKKVY